MGQVNNVKCPICQNNNGCTKDSSCWCNDESFPRDIFKLVPSEYQRKMCICKSCLDSYKESIKPSDKNNRHSDC
ncbi:cysteine-rich CWC family protein [Evansella halocellulosilytica]|uniref:cysteine-rich CWC family protein n=1 Tax=Evansella halocellulosilytica TaxID=2011013 RepID=UPI000BB6F286|nr:cysteine-rich CWC family protein [Evansella halocellulosilytica]